MSLLKNDTQIHCSQTHDTCVGDWLHVFLPFTVVVCIFCLTGVKELDDLQMLLWNYHVVFQPHICTKRYMSYYRIDERLHPIQWTNKLWSILTDVCNSIYRYFLKAVGGFNDFVDQQKAHYASLFLSKKKNIGRQSLWSLNIFAVFFNYILWV